MPRPEPVDGVDLLAQEAEAWAAFRMVLDEVPSARLRQPTFTPDGWSVRDLEVHVGGWLAACAEVLEGLQAGTWDPSAAEPETREAVDRVNAGHVALARGMSPTQALASLEAARERARRALAALEGLTAEAWSWFEESGPMHYAKHTHDLRAWLAGAPSDPRVGPLLQAEAEGWVPFRRALVLVGDRTALADPPGWTAHDVAFHVARWAEEAVADVELDRGWAQGGGDGEDRLVDAMNARWLEEGRGLAPEVVRARLDRARARLRGVLVALPTPSDEALAWFEANATEHVAEHLPALRPPVGG
jgi:hypothetical protein